MISKLICVAASIALVALLACGDEEPTEAPAATPAPMRG